MKKEEKELLMRDLSARLPYGVIALVSNEMYFDEIKPPYNIELELGSYLFNDNNVELKPYLRPMSSITEEEIFDYVASTKEERCIPELPIQPRAESTDWLNKHHYDYRGLIEKGLAIEAPEGMYEN